MEQPKERKHGIWDLPEIISGMLILFTVLWELGFMRASILPEEKLHFLTGSHTLFCLFVWFNCLTLLIDALLSWWRGQRIPTLSAWLLATSLLCGLLCALGTAQIFPRDLMPEFFWGSNLLGIVIGVFSIIHILSYMRQVRAAKANAASSRWSPAVIFFTSMMAFITLSTLLLLTPGATYKPISPIDAFFMCASATAITGLSTVDIASTFTPMGKALILLNIQVGALGIMTFTYFIMLMVGKRLAVKDRSTFSGILDQEGVNIVPSLIKAVMAVTFIVEIIGTAFLYISWKGMAGVPQEHLFEYALFHSVSAFCNAGLSLFSGNMAEPCVAWDKWAQACMMILMLAGTIGFGVYLEVISRVRQRFLGMRPALRWSTHSWLVVRSSIWLILVSSILLFILARVEPSAAQSAHWTNASWEAIWNTVGRSAGFNLSNLDDFGPAYKIFICLLMFIGGNPAGTGGGVFAPLIALCVLEVVRVLRGAPDVEINQRRIARNTVERAMATVVLSLAWIILMCVLLCVLDPSIASAKNGVLNIIFEVTSAYTTTGYSLGITSSLSDGSKLLLSFSMIFGRVGMFTFMMIFIRPSGPKLLRYPETRLPLT